MKRILLLLVALLSLTLLIGCNREETPSPEGGGSNPPAAQKAIFYIGDEIDQFALDKDVHTLILPNAPEMNGATFIGWVYEGAEGSSLYHAGASFTDLPDAGDLVFRALGVRLTTGEAAVASLTEETLTFRAQLNGEDYRKLVSLVGAENISVGMLIAPYKNVTGGNRTFTLDCAAEGLLVRANTLSATDTDAYYTLSGKSNTIAPADILEKLAGRAYLSCTFGGKTVTAYAAYYPLNHTCTLYGASAVMYEALAAADAEEAVLSPLRARLDRVVNVSMSGSILHEYTLNNIFDPAYVFTFQHYQSPYTLSEVLSNTPEQGYTTYVVKGATPDAHHTVTAYFIGRSYRTPDPAEWREDGIYIAVEIPG